MPSCVLEVNKLNKIIRNKKIINDISFKLNKGDIMGLIGPNGAGKTTLMKLIVGLHLKTSGDIIINNSINFEENMKSIGAIIEDVSLYMYLSGYENLYLNACFYNISLDEINKIVMLVGLEDSIYNKVSTYSLGMRQRLGLGICLLAKPSIIILDEPLNGLDPSGINDIKKIIRELSDNGTTVIISSHILSELENLCTRFMFINNGSIIKDIDKDSLNCDVNNYILELSNVDIDSIIYEYEKLDEVHVRIKANNDNINNIIKTLLLNNINIFEVKKEHSTLDDMFREILVD